MSITWDGPHPILSCVKTDDIIDAYRNTIHSITTDVSLCTPHTNRIAAAISTQSRAEMSPHQLAHWWRLRCLPANFKDRYTGRQSARRWCIRSSYPGTWTGDAWPNLTGWPLYARHMAQGTRKGALWFRPRGTSPASAPDWVIKGQSFTSVYMLTSQNHPTPGCILLQAISHIS